MLRVSAGVGSNLSLRAIQEEVAKNGAAKRSAGWSAFSFQAFSISSLTDVLQKEGIEDVQAAISHASVQVQVRSQLIAHMNKEVASEASAALTAVQLAAKAAKEAAAKAKSRYEQQMEELAAAVAKANERAEKAKAAAVAAIGNL